MSTVRTPQNRVNENEEVNVDKTVRATNFDPIPMPPPETEEPAKPLDGTIRAAMPMMDMPMNKNASAEKPLDGTIRVPQMPQMPIEEPAMPQPEAPKPAAPKPAAPKPVIEIVGSGGSDLSGTVRTAQSAQPQPKARPSVNISIISSVSNTQRSNRQKQQLNEVDDSIFVLKGQNYKRVKVLSENTGEAQVFLVEKNKQEFVLKVYYPNFDVNRKILQTVDIRRRQASLL